MLAMNGRATKFDDRSAQGLIRCEIELARAVVTQVARGGSSGLQAIRSNNLVGRAMFDDEVVANGIEFIGIEAVLVGRFEALPQLKVENEKAQPAGRFEVLEGFGEAEPINSCGQIRGVLVDQRCDARTLWLSEKECTGHLCDRHS